MFGRIKNFDGCVNFLKSKLVTRDALLKNLDESRDTDTLTYFLRYNAVELLGASTQADEASRFLVFCEAEEVKRDGKILTDDDKLAYIKEDVERRINDMDGLRISSRSTSLAANLEQDYITSFFLEFNSKLRG